MKNIYLVSTDKDSPLVLRDADKKLVKHTLITQWHGKKQHIYITSDEKIKAGYWSFDGENPYKWTSGDVEDCLYNPGVNNYKGCKKIILTTDQDLIKDDVQEIDDEFLGWFIKNPTCEFVEVKFETMYLNKRFGGTWQPFPDEHIEVHEKKRVYKITIPQDDDDYIQLNLKELEDKLDNQLGCETKESLTNWLNTKRKNSELGELNTNEPTENSWIRVEDQLPYKDGNSSIFVLVYDKYNEKVVRPYNEYHKCWDQEDGDDYYCDAIGGKITHWMELPDDPKN